MELETHGCTTSSYIGFRLLRNVICTRFVTKQAKQWEMVMMLIYRENMEVILRCVYEFLTYERFNSVP